MSERKCRRCGQCCANNGLIPPAFVETDGVGPLILLRHRLLRLADQYDIDYEAEPCLFLQMREGQAFCLLDEWHARPKHCSTYGPGHAPTDCKCVGLFGSDADGGDVEDI